MESMKKIRFSEHVLPHIIAVAVFLLVTVLFFKPAFFEHKKLEQHDIQQWEGSSKALRDFREQTGSEGLWAPTMFSGMPAYLINVQWGNKPVGWIKKIATLSLPHPFANIYLAFLSYYILLLCFRVRPYLAIAGALAFGLSTYMIIGLSAGHNARIGAIALMPLVMGGIHLAYRGNLLLGFGLTATGFALQLRENHLQITYYLAMIVVVYAIIRLIEALKSGQALPWVKASAVLVAAAILAVASFIGPLWSITEYSQYTIRGKSELRPDAGTGQSADGLSRSYAFEYSNGILEPMTLFLPNFYGGSSANYLVMDEESETYKALARSGGQDANQLANYTSAYWGPQSYSSPYYGGAIVFFLFVLGLAFGEKRWTWWLAPLALFGIVLSWGSYFPTFNYFLFDYLPGYSKFRSVTFALIIPLFCMPLLGFITLEKIWQEGLNPERKKKLLIVLGATAGLCLFLLVFAGMFSFLKTGEEQLPSWLTNAMVEDRKSLFRADAFRSMFFMLAVFIVIYTELYKKVTAAGIYAFLILLMLADLGSVNGRYLKDEQYKRVRTANAPTPTAADEAILKDKSYYRVYNLQNPFNEARTSYFHNSVGGYHGAKLRRYQDVIDSCLMNETNQLINDARTGELNFPQYGILNMLNARYLAYGPEATNVIRNPSALGPAWFVGRVIPVSSANEELGQLCAINTRTTAVIDTTRFKVPLDGSDSSGVITLEQRQPNYLRYKSNSASDALAVFSEVYYEKGWKAFVDNKETAVVRANYILRALPLSKGTHTIEFRFEPQSFTTGNKITTASSWLIVISLIGTIALSLRREKEDE